QMSHHASGPNFGFPRGDARLDMTDLYAFPKPGDPAKSIIVLNVHPSFRLDSPEPTTIEPFKPGALYEVIVDTNGDAADDRGCRVHVALSQEIKERAILLSTHAKPSAMTGWEVDFAAEQREIVAAMDALQGQCTSNPTSIAQWAAVEALAGSQNEDPKMAGEL